MGGLPVTLALYVVSHDLTLLQNIAPSPHLRMVSLDDLDLPSEFQGQLAESRFLLTSMLTSGGEDWCGLASARWNERFPDFPTLNELGSIFSSKSSYLNENYFVAPNVIRTNGNKFRLWLKAQDEVHPGMMALLESVMKHNEIMVTPEQKLNIVMGNSFIVSRKVAVDFLKFWQNSFRYLHTKHGLQLPFNYRCQFCGFESEEGVGRWSRVRHGGFLLERVSSLFFMSRPDLTAVRPTPRGFTPIQPRTLTSSFGFGLRLSIIRNRYLPGKTKCNHEADDRLQKS